MKYSLLLSYAIIYVHAFTQNLDQPEQYPEI